MKNIPRKYTVIRELTEGEIKAIVRARWVNKRSIFLIGSFVLLSVISGVISGVIVNKANYDIGLGIYSISVTVWFVLFCYKYYKTGNKFWNSIKDKEQPIKF